LLLRDTGLDAARAQKVHLIGQVVLSGNFLRRVLSRKILALVLWCKPLAITIGSNRAKQKPTHPAIAHRNHQKYRVTE